MLAKLHERYTGTFFHSFIHISSQIAEMENSDFDNAHLFRSTYFALHECN
jgi:hypothetical protein